MVVVPMRITLVTVAVSLAVTFVALNKEQARKGKL
jgi:hypothetical protein